MQHKIVMYLVLCLVMLIANRAFSQTDYLIREERVGQYVFFVVARSSSDPSAATLRVQRGGVVDIIGKCEGFEGSVHFGGCTLPKR